MDDKPIRVVIPLICIMVDWPIRMFEGSVCFVCAFALATKTVLATPQRAFFQPIYAHVTSVFWLILQISLCYERAKIIF